MVHRKKFTFCLLTLIFQALMRHKRICFKLFEMESSPANKIGGQIYQALGDLKFSATLGGLSQMGGLEFFTLFFRGWGCGCGNRVFSSAGGDGRSPSPTGQKFTYASPTRKSPPPVDSSTKGLSPH